jgi:cold shock CspA family protein
MSDEPTALRPRRAKATRAGQEGKPDPRGRPTSGRIVKIVRGQGHGFIRAADRREVFFHRGDVIKGTFNDLATGDAVAFEMIDDRLSGARAARVRKVRQTR